MMRGGTEECCTDLTERFVKQLEMSTQPYIGPVDLHE